MDVRARLRAQDASQQDIVYRQELRQAILSDTFSGYLTGPSRIAPSSSYRSSGSPGLQLPGDKLNPSGFYYWDDRNGVASKMAATARAQVQSRDGRVPTPPDMTLMNNPRDPHTPLFARGPSILNGRAIEGSTVMRDPYSAVLALADATIPASRQLLMLAVSPMIAAFKAALERPNPTSRDAYQAAFRNGTRWLTVAVAQSAAQTIFRCLFPNEPLPGGAPPVPAADPNAQGPPGGPPPPDGPPPPPGGGVAPAGRAFGLPAGMAPRRAAPVQAAVVNALDEEGDYDDDDGRPAGYRGPWPLPAPVDGPPAGWQGQWPPPQLPDSDDEFEDAGDDEMRGAPDPRGLYVPPYEAPGMYARMNDVGFPDVRVVPAQNNGGADWGVALGRLGVNPDGLSWNQIYEIYTQDPTDPRIAGALPYLTGQARLNGQPQPRAAAPAQPAQRGAPARLRGVVTTTNHRGNPMLQGGAMDDASAPITGLPQTELTADATEAAEQAAEGLARPAENPAPETLAAPATDQAQESAPAPVQAAATSAPSDVSASAAAAAAQVRADLKPPAIQPLTSAAAREVVVKRAKASRAREESVKEEVAAKRAKVVVVAARSAPAAAARALKLPSEPMALTTANAAPGAPYKAAFKNLTGGDSTDSPAEAPPPPPVEAAPEEADSAAEVEAEDSAPAVQDEARGQAPTVQTEKENTPAWPQGTVLAPIFRRDETTPGTAVRRNLKTRVTTARPAVKGGSSGEARVAPTKPAPQAKKTALEELLMG